MPRREDESLLGLMHEVEMLRVPPLLFGRAHADFTLSEGGAVATKSVVSGTARAAASKVVMRSGRHLVQFTMVEHGVRRDPAQLGRGGRGERAQCRPLLLQHVRRAPLPRQHRLGGDAGREAGRPG